MKIAKLCLPMIVLLYAASVLALTQKIFMVEIIFSGGQTTIGQVANGEGYPSAIEPEAEMGPYQYWLELISSSGQILEMRKFGLYNRISPRPPYPGEISEPVNTNLIDHISKIISLPYYSDIKLLKLYDANRNLLEQKDVSYLIPGCGDGQCIGKENYLSCAADCPAGGKDGWCNNGLLNTDPDCPKLQPTDKTSHSKILQSLVAGGLSLVFIISIIIYLLRKRRSLNQ